MGVVNPVIILLCDCDNKLSSDIIGHIYYRCYLIQQHLDSRLTYRTALGRLWGDRWKMLHSPLHSAAFVLHPSYQLHQQLTNEEVMNGELIYLQQIFPLPIQFS